MRERLRVVVRGAVQGVGFRPFVYRLAADLALDGWVSNSAQGLFAEFEGQRPELESCLIRLGREGPPRAVVHSLEAVWLDAVPYRGFTIRDSDDRGRASTLVMPDIATCDDCLTEIRDPADRRYRYPFTNCTNCGPRYSIIEAVPYDRAHTSMRGFKMCPACLAEYRDPVNRRFHAQPNACPACGPQLRLWDDTGRTLAAGDEALRAAGDALVQGRIVALKGLGGFQLLVNARDAGAIARLRSRKHREEKPFAVMYADLARAAGACVISALEARLLTSPEAPIVLLDKRRDGGEAAVAPNVAPGSAHLGVMLPYTPLHHLLTVDVGRPLVCTSGNLSDEPMVIDEAEAVERLGGIADVLLVHDRPIVRHVDDSIARVMLGRELVMRRARGYAPLPVDVGWQMPPTLAVGGHLKNTVAIASGSQVFISQHIGDLEHHRSRQAFAGAVASLQRLLQVEPEVVIADAHQGYASTAFARGIGLSMRQVQHHLAHVASCMAENQLTGPVLGVAWDGTGDGQDGTVWGGEFLRVSDGAFARVACLRPFRLPGGERAVREPRRSALGLLFELSGSAAATSSVLADAFTTPERTLIVQALAAGLNAPVTSSAGRLFDAAAALTGLRYRSSFEGQAAMALEAAVDPAEMGRYPVRLDDEPGRFALAAGWRVPSFVVDWDPALTGVVRDVAAQVDAGVIAARFHNTLADMIVAVAVRVGEPRVVLSGGCFQNRVLMERTVAGLRDAGFRPYWHQRVPPNDGGIALGQVAALAAAERQSATPERSLIPSVVHAVQCTS
jgi:hydrogenase maturation protein HypF